MRKLTKLSLLSKLKQFDKSESEEILESIEIVMNALGIINLKSFKRLGQSLTSLYLAMYVYEFGEFSIQKTNKHIEETKPKHLPF